MAVWGTDLMTFIGSNVKIEKDASVGNNSIILGRTVIESGVVIEDNCMIGKPSDEQILQLKGRMRQSLSLEDYDDIVDTKTVIKRNCYIQRHSTIYSGTILEEDIVCKDYTSIGWDTVVGKNSKMLFRAQVHSWVAVGEACRIGGFCCNDSRLGDRVSNFGNLLHAYREYGGGRREPAPKIGDDVIIGFGAQVIGAVTVGDNSYVAAGSVVTKNVPPNTIVMLVNKHCHISKWHGELKRIRDLHVRLE